MVYIYDRNFFTPNTTEEKTLFGNLKSFQNPEHKYSFTLSVDRPLLICVTIDTCSQLSNQCFQDIITVYKQNTKNKIIVDTSIEDYVNSFFDSAVKRFENDGVDPTDIIVLTGQNNVSAFKESFNVPYQVYTANLFEASFYNLMLFTEEQMPDIKPRKLKKHFISYIKNPRIMRVILHGFMIQRSYDKLSYYSWHDMKRFTNREKLHFYDFGLVQNDADFTSLIPCLQTRQVVDDLSFSNEWVLSQDVIDHGGINLIHETHFSLDLLVSRNRHCNLDMLDAPGKFFFTEKTFKNFYYGIPFINPSIPGSISMLESLGYKTWEEIFNFPLERMNYGASMRDYFDLIDNIASMQIQDLEDLLNSSKSMEMRLHNRDKFLEQNQLKKIIKILEAEYDK